jgi:hypothetical protein
MSDYRFRSCLFAVEPGEDEATNPRRYGRQFTTWLAAKLRELGYDVEQPIAEDWGWCVVCKRGPDRFIAGCGNEDDFRPPDEALKPPVPTEIHWHCFPFAASPMWRRLFRRREVAMALQRFDLDLRAILEAEPGIVLTQEP